MSEMKEATKWVMWAIAICVFITVIGWVMRPVDMVVERAVLVNSHQYKEGMADRAAVLGASIAEVESRLMTTSDSETRKGLENQASALRIQLKAIRR